MGTSWTLRIKQSSAKLAPDVQGAGLSEWNRLLPRHPTTRTIAKTARLKRKPVKPGPEHSRWGCGTSKCPYDSELWRDLSSDALAVPGRPRVAQAFRTMDCRTSSNGARRSKAGSVAEAK